MKKHTTLFLLLFCIQGLSQDSFQLAKPLVKYESIFFRDSAKLELKFAQPGAKIYYTINNDMPSETSILYKKPIVLKNQFTTVKAKVFCNGFIPSETIEYSFAKGGQKIKRITSSLANSKYSGSGDSTLFDNKGGIENISSKTWMGFDSDTILLNIELAEKQYINEVLLSFLRNESSWIFLPKQVHVYYYDKGSDTYKLYRKAEFSSATASLPGCVLKRIAIPKPIIKSDKMKVMLVTVNKIPDWHPAKGQHAWCFIDEIKVY
jgi:hypothetical protein